MKIALIEPKSHFNQYLFYKKFPHLGNLFLGKLLQNAGHEVKIFKESLTNFYNERRDKLHHFIREADAVGFTTISPTVKRAYQIADVIKRQFPHKKIVFGGNHVSALPEEALQHADQVVVGEGENVILDVFEGINTDKIVQGSRVDINKVPAVDLSLIHGFETNKKKTSIKYAPIMSSRGCPFNCIFCSVIRMFGRKIRVRDVDLVMEEIMLRYHEGFRYAFFYDDNFSAHFEKTKILLEKLIRADLDFYWMCQCRVDVAKDRELLDLLHRSKCVKLFIGVESLNPKSLHEYNKRQTVKQIKESISLIHKVGINIHLMFMFGADNDDEATIDETIQFSKFSGCRSAQFSILYPIPGTLLYEKMKVENRIFIKDWNYYDGTHSVFLLKNITPYQLQKKFIHGYKYFYSISTGIRYLTSRLVLSIWKLSSMRYLKYLRYLTRRLKNAGLLKNGILETEKLAHGFVEYIARNE